MWINYTKRLSYFDKNYVLYYITDTWWGDRCPSRRLVSRLFILQSRKVIYILELKTREDDITALEQIQDKEYFRKYR